VAIEQERAFEVMAGVVESLGRQLDEEGKEKLRARSGETLFITGGEPRARPVAARASRVETSFARAVRTPYASTRSSASICVRCSRFSFIAVAMIDSARARSTASGAIGTFGIAAHSTWRVSAARARATDPGKTYVGTPTSSSSARPAGSPCRPNRTARDGVGGSGRAAGAMGRADAPCFTP